MTATDELRRLLDERGVEYTDAEDAHTQHTWWSDGDHEIAACNSGERLAVYNLTPEQAVEATLGRGTCRQIETEEGFIVCSECGAPQPEDYTVYYCWCCGRKVVGS